MANSYGDTFREAYALLHGGHTDQAADAAERRAGEGMQEYLARTRNEALGSARQRLLAEEPPPEMEEPHRLLLNLLANASEADKALAEQVASYQCGQFHQSVGHSDRLQNLVIESQRMDRDLITALKSLPAEAIDELGIEI